MEVRMSLNPNSIVRNDFPLISSPEDARLIAEFIRFDLTDKIRDALRSELNLASSKIASIELIGQLGIRVQKNASGNYTEVTPEKISANKIDSAALQSLFLNDSPKLGENLSEAKETFTALQDAGFSVVAPKEFPILLEIYDKENKLISENFSWISQDLRDSLNFLDPVNSTLPGSLGFEGKGGGDSTVRVIAFDEFANLRPTQAALEKNKNEIFIKLNSLVTDFSKILAQSIVTSNRLEVRTSEIIEDSKQEINRINSLNLQRFEQFNEVLKNLRLRVLEDDEKLIINEEKIQDISEIDQNLIALLKNSSSRVEGPLTLELDEKTSFKKAESSQVLKEDEAALTFESSRVSSNPVNLLTFY